MASRDERILALALAKQLMDQTDAQPGIDPDDDLRMLSRQLLRGQEVIDRLKATLANLHDPMADLIQANRDEILKKHEEAIRRILRCLGQGKLATIRDVCNAVNSFHPMHTESWCGWPKESDQ